MVEFCTEFMWLFIGEDLVIKMCQNEICSKSEEASNLMVRFLFEGVKFLITNVELA
jgi:hypothetical protein